MALWGCPPPREVLVGPDQATAPSLKKVGRRLFGVLGEQVPERTSSALARQALGVRDHASTMCVEKQMQQ